MENQSNVKSGIYRKKRQYLSRRILKVLFAVLCISKNTQIVYFFIKAIFKNGRKNAFLKTKLTILSLYEQYRISKYSFPYRYRVSIDKKKVSRKIRNFNVFPRFSVFLYATEDHPEKLLKSIMSVNSQYYPSWQIFINDARKIPTEKLIYLHEDKINIVSDSRDKKIKQSDYIISLQAGDEITPDALFRMAEHLNQDNGNTDVIYSDEDCLTNSRHYTDPSFKPSSSPEFLLSKNYIGNLTAVRVDMLYAKNLICHIFNNDCYGLLLKLLVLSNGFYHLPYVLYHKKKMSDSDIKECHIKEKNVLENHLKEFHVHADVIDGIELCSFRINYQINNRPKVSIIIPFKDQSLLLEKCLNSIYDKSTHPEFEIIAINNSSVEADTGFLMERYSREHSNIKFIDYHIPFNFSRIINFGVKYVSGEHLLILNNDIEIISSSWIESLLEHSQRPEIGAVGAKLYYPDDTVQHAGVIMFPSRNKDVIAKHFHQYFPRESSGINGRLNMIQNVSAVTAACMMVKKSLFDEIGGFNEEHLAVAFNDVDFCLRLLKRGYRNIFTPYCEAYHYESVSRGYEHTVEKRKRIIKEGEYIKKEHGEYLEFGDPYFNPNLIY